MKNTETDGADLRKQYEAGQLIVLQHKHNIFIDKMNLRIPYQHL